jgi:hypothetical protein
MKTLSVAISDVEFSKFGLKREDISFSDLIELVSKELTKQTLSDSVTLAEQYGLSKMSMDAISKEVKAVRKHAKNNS